MSDNLIDIDRSTKPIERSVNKEITKRGLLVFVPIFILLTVAIISYVHIQETVEDTLLQNTEKQIVDVRQENVQTILTNILNDLMILSLNSQIEKYWQESDNTELVTKLNQDLLTISKHRKIYDQLRLLDTSGMEIIRINYNHGNPEIISKDKLQNKSNRYYFEESIILEKNEIYISPLDLNIENGEIEKPLKPMIRFATPVFDKEGVKQGIVLLNYFGQEIIDQFSGRSNPLANNQLMLLNSDGYWLRGSDQEKEFGFMYNDKKQVKFDNSYPEVWTRVKIEESGQFETEKGLFTFETIYPLISNRENGLAATDSSHIITPSHENEYFWKIVSFIPSDILNKKQNSRRQISALLLVVLSVVLVFISWLFAKYRYNRIKTEQQLRTIFNASQVGITLIKDGKFLFVNQYLCNLMEYRNDELVDRETAVLFPTTEESELAYKRILKGLNRQKPVIQEIRLTTKSDDVLNILINSSFYNGKNATDGIISVLTDITKQKKAEKELLNANITKDKFFSIIAHDLKGPLSTQKALADMLYKNFSKYEDEKKKEFLYMINTGLTSIQSLLDNLLTWSRSQLGRIKYNPEKLNLHHLISESVLVLQNSTKRKNIAIDVKVDKKLHLFADEDTVGTVLRNLLSNAIKFTNRSGLITISAHKTEGKKHKKKIQVNITDTGIGIPDSTIYKIFDIGQNVSSAGTENETGTGLGLILCKEFIENNGGEIWVESEPGKGSTFSFTVPEG